MLTISTFNIKNDYFKFKKEKTNKILKYIKENDIDIIGLQEVYKKLDKDINKNIKKAIYNKVGKYRFISKVLLRPVNESTPIITNKEIVSICNYRLPFFPSFPRRIMTKIVINYNDELISIYNTHLDYRNRKVQEKELKYIYNIIKEDNNRIVLMGDFNLKIKHKIFKEFIKLLEELNINKVSINGKTLKQSKEEYAIDHIFISNSFKVKTKKIIKNLDISDHYPLLIEIM